jgi:ABC-type amino acid transport substrate-binding protein
MMKRIGWMLVLALGLLAGCSSSGHGEQEGRALRVGVMPDYPPLVFREEGKGVGVERDFAEHLSSDLERPLSLHEYTQLSDLFAALKNNEIDIIMSGISITPARQKAFAFSLPYTAIGQMTMIRLDDAARLATPGALFTGRYRVGYKNGTTGQAFVQETMDAQTQGFNSNTEATQALVNGEIDAFIHDAPTVWNLANKREYPVKLLGLYKPLTKEQLAWVMRKHDSELKQQVDTVLKSWVNNGFLMQTKTQWIPVKILSGQ